MTIPESSQQIPAIPGAPKKDSGLAIASLVCGIAAWFIFPVVSAIAAVITGHLAKKEIRASNGTMGGDGMALAGLLMGYIQLGLFVLAIIVITVLVLVFAPSGRVVLNGLSMLAVPLL